jgi:hypothetical protein
MYARKAGKRKRATSFPGAALAGSCVCCFYLLVVVAVGRNTAARANGLFLHWQQCLDLTVVSPLSACRYSGHIAGDTSLSLYKFNVVPAQKKRGLTKLITLFQKIVTSPFPTPAAWSEISTTCTVTNRLYFGKSELRQGSRAPQENHKLALRGKALSRLPR